MNCRIKDFKVSEIKAYNKEDILFLDGYEYVEPKCNLENKFI